MNIKTNSYNDLSWLTWEQKSDKEFLMNLFKEHKANGGDVSLLVQDSKSYDGSVELITLKDYISKHIQSPDSFLELMIENGLINSPYDLNFDKSTGLIYENKGFGLNKMKVGLERFENVIINGIENFINNLPNYDEIKGLSYYDFDGVEKISNKNPLFTIADTLNHPKVYDLIFNKFPEIKNLWLREDKDGIPYFLHSCDSRYSECRDYEVAKVFFSHEIGNEFIFKNNKLAYSYLKQAAMFGDLEILNKILPKINLDEAEKGLYPYDLALTRAKNKDVAKLLLDNGLKYDNEILTSSGNKIYVNIIYSDEIKRIEIIEAIFEKYPEIQKDVIDNIYPSLKGKDFNILKTLIEKYNFPVDKYDLLSLVKNDDELDCLKSLGVNFEICNEFCSKAVLDREDGLKRIRALSKKGILSNKSPNLIFNILSSKPTKTFINYIIKNDVKELENTTIEGFPAWWGANNNDIITYFSSNKINKNQKSNDGMPLVYYLIEREAYQKQLGTSNTIEKLFPNDCKIDLDYSDKNGNNVLHHMFFRKRFGKDRIDVKLYNKIKENSNVDVYSLVVTPNNDGITPLEVLIKSEVKGGWDAFEIITDLLENGSDVIKLNSETSDGKTICEHLVEFCQNNEALKKEIEVRGLSDQLNKEETTTNKPKKMKI